MGMGWDGRGVGHNLRCLRKYPLSEWAVPKSTRQKLCENCNVRMTVQAGSKSKPVTRSRKLQSVSATPAAARWMKRDSYSPTARGTRQVNCPPCWQAGARAAPAAPTGNEHRLRLRQPEVSGVTGSRFENPSMAAMAALQKGRAWRHNRLVQLRSSVRCRRGSVRAASQPA